MPHRRLAGRPRVPHARRAAFSAWTKSTPSRRPPARLLAARVCDRSAACRWSSRGEALGTLNVGSRARRLLHPRRLDFFTQVAGQVAIALDNALSYKRIEELNARLAEEKVYLEDEIRTDNRFEEIVGQSRALQGHSETGGDGGAHRFHGADLRRNRHRQGTAGARHPRPELAPPGHLRQAELRRHPHRPARKRNVRPRKGRLHRGHRPAHRPL